MAIDALNNVTQTGTLAAAASPDADRQEIKRLAEQFEAMLMTQMLREMRRSMIDDEDEEGLGADIMTDTGDIEFGNAMSKQGGLGLTDQMLAVFERQIAALSAKQGPAAASPFGSVTDGVSPIVPTIGNNPVVAPPTSPQTQGTALSPSDLAHGAPSVADQAAVSSGFGWRRDPFSGASRFHSGVDLAVAYGRDVKAAAEGVVAFAGAQNGYGNTVVIDHGGGRQTRYAHLSAPLVRAGESVGEGQVVGKSGNSGRTTGPHLHFEMLVNGRAVDPLSHEM